MKTNYDKDSQFDYSFRENSSDMLIEYQNEQKPKKRTKSSLVKISYEEALTLVGSRNWYQIRCFIIFALQWFLAANILLCPPFLFQDPQFYCDNKDLSDEACKKQVCELPQDEQAQYIHYGGKSIGDLHAPATKEFKMYCGDAYKQTIISSIQSFGSLLGFILFPMISDNKGPRLALLLSWATSLVGVIIMAVTNNYILMVIGFFFAGLGVNPAITLHFTLINDHSIGKLREFTAIGIQVSYGFGELFMIWMAYLFIDWRNFVIFILVIPISILMILTFFVYESPKFVYQRDSIKSVSILNKIARINGKEKLHVNALQSIVHNKETKQYSMVDLFRYKSLRITSYAAGIVFFIIQLVYYGVSFTMSGIGLNIYLNFVIISVAETIAYAITDILVPYIQRKRISLIGLISSALISLSFLFLKTDCDGICTTKIIQIAFAAILRFTICFVWTVVYIYDSEMFPASVRSLALGFVSLMGTIGSTGAPYLVSFIKDTMNPMIILGIFAVIGALHVLPLKETKGKALLDQIKEIECDPDELVVEVNDESMIKHQLSEVEAKKII